MTLMLCGLLAVIAPLLEDGCAGVAWHTRPLWTRPSHVFEGKPADRAALSQPRDDVAVLREDTLSKPEAAEPALSLTFLGPRPASFPFRMDWTVKPGRPVVFELSPFTLGSAAEDRLRKRLQSEVARYPAGTVTSVLDEVIIGDKLTLNGLSVGGTCQFGVVLIAAGEIDNESKIDTHVVRAFHHELSSVLLNSHSHKFDEARFRSALPAGFVYRDDRPDDDRTQRSDSQEFTATLELLEAGFLFPWAMDNVVQDFNSYAEVLMCRPELLLETFAPESRIGRKARVVRDFYLSIDPRFEEMFRKSGPESPDPSACAP